MAPEEAVELDAKREQRIWDHKPALAPASIAADEWPVWDDAAKLALPHSTPTKAMAVSAAVVVATTS